MDIESGNADSELTMIGAYKMRFESYVSFTVGKMETERLDGVKLFPMHRPLVIKYGAIMLGGFEKSRNLPLIFGQTSNECPFSTPTRERA